MQYDQPVASTTLGLGLALNPRITDDVLASIEAILETETTPTLNVGTWDGGDNFQAPEGAPADVVIITPPEGEGFSGELPQEILDAKVTIWDTDDDLTLTYNSIERVIVTGNGNDDITVNGDQNTTLATGDGDDTVQTSGGDDSISTGAGDDSVSSGAGNDTIDSGIGNDTIDGGEGFDVVLLDGEFEAYTVDVVDGQIVFTRDGEVADSVTATNVEFFQLDNYSIAAAGTEDEANVLRLYQGILGRETDLEGAQYWLNDLNEEGYSVTDIANAFFYTEEGSSALEQSDEEFVAMLYQNALGREGDDSEIAYWVNDLNEGQSHAQVVVSIVGSEEAADSIINVKFIDGLV